MSIFAVLKVVIYGFDLLEDDINEMGRLHWGVKPQRGLLHILTAHPESAVREDVKRERRSPCELFSPRQKQKKIASPRTYSSKFSVISFLCTATESAVCQIVHQAHVSCSAQ